jgi:hypothetical protein
MYFKGIGKRGNILLEVGCKNSISIQQMQGFLL